MQQVLEQIETMRIVIACSKMPYYLLVKAADYFIYCHPQTEGISQENETTLEFQCFIYIYLAAIS